MIAVPNYISSDEYLDIEQRSTTRYEYRRGLVYAMAGGTDNHDHLALNLLNLINAHSGDSELWQLGQTIALNSIGHHF